MECANPFPLPRFSLPSLTPFPSHAVNDVITYANLIYLGHITGRVPVVPIFIPSHIGGDAPSIRFGEVFDVPRFVKDSGIPLVEWHEVKDPASEAIDELGCWNVWEAVQSYEHQPRYSWVTDHLGLGESPSLPLLLVVRLLSVCAGAVQRCRTRARPRGSR